MYINGCFEDYVNNVDWYTNNEIANISDVTLLKTLLQVGRWNG